MPLRERVGEPLPDGMAPKLQAQGLDDIRLEA